MRGLIPSLNFIAIHSKLHNLILCDNQSAHAIEEFCSVNMGVRLKRINVACDKEITQNQHCNNDNDYNDDNVMRPSRWFELFGGLF